MRLMYGACALCLASGTMGFVSRTVAPTEISVAAPKNEELRKKMIGAWRCKDVSIEIKGLSADQMEAAKGMIEPMKEKFRKSFTAQFKVDGTYTLKAPNPMEADGVSAESGKWSLAPDGKTVNFTSAKNEKESFKIDIKDKLLVLNMSDAESNIRLTLIP